MSNEEKEELKEILMPIIETMSNFIKDIWSKINGDLYIQYKKIYEQSNWKYVKKGKRYVKVRRKNVEDISKTFSRKILHYNKQILRSVSPKSKS